MALLLAAGVFFLCLAFTPGLLFTTDSWTMHLTAQSLARGDGLPIPPEHQSLPAPNGRHYSVYGALQPLLAAPLIWIGWGAEAAFGDHWNAVSPISNASEFFAATFNCFITALLTGVVFLVLFRASGNARVSAITALSLALSTLLLPYSREFFVQTLQGLLLVIAVDAGARLHHRMQARFVIQLALAMALLLANRIDGIVAWGILGPWFLWCLFRVHTLAPSRVAWTALSLFILILALGLAAEFAHNWLRSGTLLFLHRRVIHLFWWNPLRTLPDILFNPYRSLLLYAPLTLLLLVRPRSWRPTPLTLLCWLLVATYGLFYATYQEYKGGVNPGPRLFLILYPLLFIPLGLRAAGEWRLPSFRAAWWTLFALGFAVNAAESLVDYTRGESIGGYIADTLHVGGGLWHKAQRERPRFVWGAWAFRRIAEGQVLLGIGYAITTASAGALCIRALFRTISRVEQSDTPLPTRQ